MQGQGRERSAVGGGLRAWSAGRRRGGACRKRQVYL